LVADSLIDKVLALERRAEEMVAEARAQAQRLEEEAARQLKETQARYQGELEQERQALRDQQSARLQEALGEEDRRFAGLSAEIKSTAEPQVGSAAEEVTRSFFEGGRTGSAAQAQSEGGGEAGHGH
jgi:hypothetical protein